MNKEQKIALMKNRIATMEQNGKNVKAPGVLRALKRELRNIEKEIKRERGEIGKHAGFKLL